MQVFKAAEKHEMAVLVHTWVGGNDYGAEHAKAFIKYVLPAAPRTVVQIAHLAGSGPGYDGDAAFEVYAEASAAGDDRLDNVWFDVATSVTDSASQATLDLVTKRLRTAGLDRVVFGSDFAGLMNAPPASAWNDFKRLPLAAHEFSAIATKLAPYMTKGCDHVPSGDLSEKVK